ncbi:MAG: DNRLRE domain-containing protein [Promethearchaeota archaeon]|nr:MAG: DNRLRE domain-containing protein [Candidatus Lokiarchaeota archaeon]
MTQKLKNRVVEISFLLFLFFIIILIIVMPYFTGYQRVINVAKDSYVSEHTPNANHGSEQYLLVGKYGDGTVYTYYYFNISSHSSEWKKAWIHVIYYYGTNLIDIGVNHTYNNWEETTITWHNRPESIKYKGHILCDGFDFRIPVDLDEIIDGGLSICLYGKQEGEEGYIQGYSKEGASYDSQMAWIELTYAGYDPDTSWIVMGVLILVVSIIGLIVLALLISRHSKPIRVKPKHKHITLPPDFNWDENADAIHKKIAPAAQMNPIEMMARYYPKSVPTLEKEINHYITLKLEYGRTFIYVNGKRFVQCIRLVLNIQKNEIPLYDEIESIDEAAEVYQNHIYQNRIVRGLMAAPVPDQSHNITPEQEFWGHCSNLQAWVENNYDTRILMSNISFPLLRELSKAGDPVARRVYKEEIALRLESGYRSVVQYILAQGYLGEFSSDEFETMLDSTDLIQKLSSDLKVLSSLLNSCIRKFPTLIEKIIIQVLNLPSSENILLSMIRRDISYSQLPGFIKDYSMLRISQFLINMKNILESYLKKVDENKQESILNCVKAINEQLSKYEKIYHLSKKRSYLDRSPIFQKPIIKNLPLEQFETDKVKAKTFKAKYKISSRCRFCGKMIPKDKDFCEWCGHKKSDDDDRGDFFPFLFIFKPPGGGGSMKAVALVHSKEKAL